MGQTSEAFARDCQVRDVNGKEKAFFLWKKPGNEEEIGLVAF